jgi:hypothetical protein
VLFADDVHAQLNAFIADEYSRASNQFAHLMLALSAKRTEQGSFFSIIFFCHFTAPALDLLASITASQ